MVRKGINGGLKTVVTGDVLRFYRIYSESVRNLGTPVFSRRLFEELMRVFADDAEIAVLQWEARDVAALMSFHFRDEVLPYFGGSRPVARSLKANDFMYWELMCRAAERGARLFDFGRSKVGTGAYAFKKNWGFEPQLLGYDRLSVNGQALPDVNPLSPRYRRVITVWRRLPLPLANSVGPWVSRHLG
jgi:FemAB-related protein (PEP-CTERM system-associated)